MEVMRAQYHVFQNSFPMILDLDQECFCRLRDDPATEQTRASSLYFPFDPTEAIADEETFCVRIEAFARCGQEPEDFEDITETRRFAIRAANQTDSRGG